MGVDQAGEQVAAGEVDDARAGEHRLGQLGGGQDRLDRLAARDQRHAGPGRAAGAVDQGDAAIDGPRLPGRRCERRAGRSNLAGRAGGGEEG